LILYVNGDSHSAGAEAVNSYCFAEDDSAYRNLGRKPHPDNLEVSYGRILANNLSALLHCDAESASSNDRIIRTTREYLNTSIPNLIVIGWSTWEREEIQFNQKYYQFSVGCLGIDWPEEVKNIYQDWLTNINHKQKEQESHERIWTFHKELKDIPHLFFNSYLAFNSTEHFNWTNNYLHPYDENQTYYHWLGKQGHQTVNPNSYHYGTDAHQIWANQLTKIINESIITK
jgi:hypothetical protein